MAKCILLFMLLLLSNAAFGKSDTYTDHSECGYTMISRDLVSEDSTGDLDSIAATFIKDYGQFKQELTDTINDCMPAKYKEDNPEYTAEEIEAWDIYEFEADSDLVILRYYAPEMRFFFVGYIKSQGVWFSLIDNTYNEIESKFNTILGLCSQLRQAPLLCKSVILLGLKYNKPENCILYNLADIAGVSSYGWDKHNRLPDSIDYPRPFYFLNISADTTLNKYFYKKFYKTYEKYFKKLRNSFTLIPPQIKLGVDRDTVELTLFNTYFGEIAAWRLIYNKEGYIKSSSFAHEPLVTFHRISETPCGSPPRVRTYGLGQYDSENEAAYLNDSYMRWDANPDVFYKQELRLKGKL